MATELLGDTYFGAKEDTVKPKRPAPKPPQKKKTGKTGRHGLREKLGFLPLKKRPLLEDHTQRHGPYSRCATCLSTLVFCFNIFLLAFGSAILGFGIWFFVKQYNSLAVLIGSKLFLSATITLIAGGGLVTLLSLCGCSRSLRESRCFLGFYGVTLSLVVLILVGGGVVAFIFRKSAESSTSMSELELKLEESFGVDLHKNVTNRQITDAWDSVQSSLECCGILGDINSSTSWAFFKLRSRWYFQSNERTPYVPDSCCSDNITVCQGTYEIFGPPTKGPPVEYKYTMNPYLYTDGCYHKAIEHIKKYALILGLVSGGVPAVLCLGIVAIFCLCRRIPARQSDDTDGKKQRVETIHGYYKQ